jgi:hypothetical protein
MSRYVERGRVTFASEDRPYLVIGHSSVNAVAALMQSYDAEPIRKIRLVIRDTDDASKRTLFCDNPKTADVVGWLDLMGGAR